MQSLLLTMLALFSAIGISRGGSSSGSSQGIAKKQEDPGSQSGNSGNNNGGGNTPPPVSGGDSTPSNDAPNPPLPSDVTPPPPPTQDVDPSDGGGVTPTEVTSTSYNVSGGRVTTLELNNSDNISSVRVLEDPSHGNLSVNPDNTLALVMTMDHEFSGNMNLSYEVTYNNGSTETFNDTVGVAPTTQAQGWGEGEFYMLETDEDGDLIVEAGENHREVYISGNNSALSLSDIAAIEGISVSQVTGEWLAANTEYGASEGMALDSEAGMRLWYEITGNDNAPSSDWLLFERGYEYNNLGDVVTNGSTGEDELHPIHITAYGTGDSPVLNTQIWMSPYLAPWTNETANIVISDLSVTGGISALSGSNLIVTNTNITNEALINGKIGLNINDVQGFTLHNSSITDIYNTSHPDGAGSWSPSDMSAGLLAGYVEGFLMEGNLFDQNGWSPTYNDDYSLGGGQTPSQFSHNVYVDWGSTDVTFRDNITMRGSNFGAHIRGGGFVEDNLFLDNNAAVDFLGGNFENAGFVSNYTLFADNVITSAGHKDIDGIGWLTAGVINHGLETTMVDNIVAHLADPNNPEEIAEKFANHWALLGSETPFYDDTIIYNWLSSGWDPDPNTADRNVDGLNQSVLNATTIQTFTQQLLGDPNAGIPELAAFLRAQAAGQFDDTVDADVILNFFQSGFGLAVDGRLSAETLRFVPDELGEGIRWDNRLNWDTEDLPGSVNGDSVDLGGNYVNYGGTTTIEDLDFGEGGTLNVSHGRLNIEDHTATGEAGGELNISGAGQLWMDGYTDRDLLEIDVDGGRFVNTGLFVGRTDIDATDGDVVLGGDGADFALSSGSRLEISGDDARIGFDGSTNGTGVLLLSEGSELAFTAQSGEGLSAIQEFNTGSRDLEGGNVQSGVNLGNATLELNVSGLTNGTHNLISVNEIIGEFGEINVNGLGSRDATINIDYANDRVQLQLGSGTGQTRTNVVGNENDAQTNSDLWDALTNGHGIYPDDPASSIPSEEDVLDEAV